jgi:hypothetical protein
LRAAERKPLKITWPYGHTPSSWGPITHGWPAREAPPPAAPANLGFAVFLAVATAVSLSALLNARYVLEDPFVSGPLDTVRVGKELRLVQHNLWAMTAAGEDDDGDDDAKRDAAAADACCGVPGDDEGAQQQQRGARRVTVERAAPAPP